MAAVAFGLVLALGAGPAAAHEGDGAATDGTAVTRGGMVPPGQGFDVSVLGATRTRADGTVEEVTQPVAEAFVRTWFGGLVFDKLTQQAPPDGVSKDRVDVSLVTNDGVHQHLLVDLAYDATGTWIALATQDLDWMQVATPTWVRAPEATRAVLDGAVPVESVNGGGAAGRSNTNAAAAAELAADEEGAGGRRIATPLLVAGAAVALVLAYFAFTPEPRKRRHPRHAVPRRST